MSITDIQTIYAEKAEWFHRFEKIERLITGRYRRQLFDGIDNKVLDVACGTGTNFPYLTETAELTGIDISPEMLHKAESRLDDLALDGTLYRMDAQALDFDDNQFDWVISALSTCTFPDPIKALNEMGRVCAPSGKIHLLEHGRSGFGPISWYQELRADAHYQKTGCHWTQEPLHIIQQTGLTIEAARTAFGGIITMVEARPNLTSDG